eukprot:2029815-Pyramimonas_sp.AAC.1
MEHASMFRVPILQVACPYCHPLYGHPPPLCHLKPCDRVTLTRATYGRLALTDDATCAGALAATHALTVTSQGCDRGGDDTVCN